MQKISVPNLILVLITIMMQPNVNMLTYHLKVMPKIKFIVYLVFADIFFS